MPDADCRAEGVVSVWLGTFPHASSCERYFEEDWANLDADGFPACRFWEDLGIRWFDQDFQERGFVGSPIPLAELFALNWSYLESFREPLLAACAARPITTANSVVFLHDFDYRDGSRYRCPHMTFVGAFPYSKGNP
jgi:hypothetical protein